MKVGVMGTRKGMTAEQRNAFSGLLYVRFFDEFHHGSCRGVDVETAEIVDRFFGGACTIVRHPGPANDPNQEDSVVDDDVLPPKNHFARNRDIVDAVDLLIVIPKDMERQERGGTWYTHDYAVKKGKPIKIIRPNGRVEDKP